MSGVAALAVTGPGDPQLCRGDSRGGPSEPVTLANRLQFLLVDFDSVVSGLVSQRTYPLTAPLDPGTYTVNAVSWDGYEGRGAIAHKQPAERWFAELLDASGAVLATTAATPDLADDADEAMWSGTLGEISWAAGRATAVRVVHAELGAPTPNSVVPVCVAFLGVGVKPDGVSSSTTVPPTTTTGAGAGAVTTTVAPTTTVPSTSVVPTTVAGRVEAETVAPPAGEAPPEVEVKGVQVTNVGPAQTANPVPAQPTFTG